MDKDMMIKFLTSMIPLRLDYAGGGVWSPNMKHEEEYKKIRKNPKSSHKNGTRIERSNV